MKEEYLKERAELDRQIAVLMPLIEQERAVYIKAEYGRLQSVIGTGYWSEIAGSSEIFHGRMGDDLALIEDRPKDPYDITIEELYWITTQYKRIERCGTETYLNFFNMMPEDKKRISLLAEVWHKLSHEMTCSQEEIDRIKYGHDDFIASKLAEPVEVIR